MAPFLPVRAVSRSQRVRIGGVTIAAPKTSSEEGSVVNGVLYGTTYVDLNPSSTAGKPKAYPPLKELKNHLTLGAVIVVGPLTNSNATVVIQSGYLVTNTKSKTPSLKVSSGVIENRSTGVYQFNLETVEKTLAEAAAGKEIVTAVFVKESNGAVKIEEGAEAAEGTAKAPVTPAGSFLISTVVVKNAAETAANSATNVGPRV
jgi:hypothetical protein